MLKMIKKWLWFGLFYMKKTMENAVRFKYNIEETWLDPYFHKKQKDV